MAILDGLTPAYYQVLSMNVRRAADENEVVVIYRVAILSMTGNRVGNLRPKSALTTEEKQALAAIYLRDKAQFEQASGLEEWVEPEHPS